MSPASWLGNQNSLGCESMGIFTQKPNNSACGLGRIQGVFTFKSGAVQVDFFGATTIVLFTVRRTDFAVATGCKQIILVDLLHAQWHGILVKKGGFNGCLDVLFA